MVDRSYMRSNEDAEAIIRYPSQIAQTISSSTSHVTNPVRDLQNNLLTVSLYNSRSISRTLTSAQVYYEHNQFEVNEGTTYLRSNLEASASVPLPVSAYAQTVFYEMVTVMCRRQSQYDDLSSEDNGSIKYAHLLMIKRICNNVIYRMPDVPLGSNGTRMERRCLHYIKKAQESGKKLSDNLSYSRIRKHVKKIVNYRLSSIVSDASN